MSTLSGTCRPGRVKHVIALPVDKQVRWEDTLSPLVISWQIVIIGCILVVAAIVSYALGTIIPSGIGLFIALFPAWKIVRWRWEWRVITDCRYIDINGIRADDVHYVELKDIRSVDYKRPIVASMFGLKFWNFVITSVDDTVTHIPAVRDATAVALLLGSKKGVATGP